MKFILIPIGIILAGILFAILASIALSFLVFFIDLIRKPKLTFAERINFIRTGTHTILK